MGMLDVIFRENKNGGKLQEEKADERRDKIMEEAMMKGGKSGSKEEAIIEEIIKLNKETEYEENEILREIPELYDLFEWCREESTEDEVRDVRNIFEYEGFRSLYKYNQENPEYDAKVAEILESRLCHMDVMKACAVSHYCGVLIEKCGIFNIGFGLVDLFEKVISQTYDFIERVVKDGELEAINISAQELMDNENLEDEKYKELFNTYPDETRVLMGAELLTLAVMDVITRRYEVRQYLRSKNMYKKIRFLQPYIKSIVYTEIVHDACYDYKIMVLCPENKKGFYMKAYDIHNCFYLMTMLEAEIYLKGWAEDYNLEGYEFNEDLYNVTLGNAYPDKLYIIESHSAYSTYDAVKKAKGDSGCLSSSCHIFGEMPPEYIPQYKGCPIIIMSKGLEDRRMSWDSNFTFKCHDGMDPHIEILDELSTDEVDKILEDLSGDEIEADKGFSAYYKKTIEILNDKVKGSVLEGDSVIIPDIGLEIKLSYLQLQSNGVQAEFTMNHESFIEELREFVIGIDGSIHVALKKAVESFCSAALSGIMNGLYNKGGQDVQCRFNGMQKKFKLYRGGKASLGERTNFKDTDYWSIVEDEIKNRLGNKPIYWVKIYISKNDTSYVSCECRINDVVSDEITKLLNDIAEKWDITTQFCDEKQYFVLIQDKLTYIPYKFSKEQVVKYTLKAVDLYKNCDTEEKYESIFKDIYKICGDISLATDLTNFIPEMMCQIFVAKAKYSEFFFMNNGKNQSIQIYRDSLTSYNWIFETLLLKAGEKYFSREEIETIISLSSMLKCLNAAIKNESPVLKSVCYFPVSDNYVIG